MHTNIVVVMHRIANSNSNFILWTNIVFRFGSTTCGKVDDKIIKSSHPFACYSFGGSGNSAIVYPLMLNAMAKRGITFKCYNTHIWSASDNICNS